MELELVSLDSLTPDPRNARSHAKGIPELAASLSAFGQQKNCVIKRFEDLTGKKAKLLKPAK